MSHPRGVTLVLDGVAYELLFDLNAMVLLRQKHGINMLNPSDEDWADPVAIRAMLWAGLQRFHGDKTLEWVGEVVTLKEWPEATKAITAAYQAAREPEGEVAGPLAAGATQSP